MGEDDCDEQSEETNEEMILRLETAADQAEPMLHGTEVSVFVSRLPIDAPFQLLT